MIKYKILFPGGESAEGQRTSSSAQALYIDLFVEFNVRENKDIKIIVENKPQGYARK